MRALKRLFRLLVPYRTTLAVSVVLLLVRAGLELLPPLFQRPIIDDVVGSKDLSRLGVSVAALMELGGLYGQLDGRMLGLGRG